MKALSRTLAVTLLALGPAVAHAQSDYHHMHFSAPDTKAAAAWYTEHMGCEDFGREGACQIGSTQMIWFGDRPDAAPSVGTGVDHIGFSFPDLEAKVAEWQAAGLELENPNQPIREVEGLFKLAFLTDPWGTRIEAVEDAEWPAFHHIHLASADPDAAIDWYERIFGGERDSLKGMIAGLRYGGVWLLARQADAPAGTRGTAIDHLGFAFANLEAAAADIRAQGVEFTMEPRPYTNPLGQEMQISFVMGPDDVFIEIVQPGT